MVLMFGMMRVYQYVVFCYPFEDKLKFELRALRG